MARTIHDQIRNLPRHAWTGGDTPDATAKSNPNYLALRSLMFREMVQECGGLDLWECSGTSSLERARILWNRATLDAWRTIEANAREALREIRGRFYRTSMMIVDDI
jgi:hypothetical protein